MNILEIADSNIGKFFAWLVAILGFIITVWQIFRHNKQNKTGQINNQNIVGNQNQQAGRDINNSEK